MTPERLAEIERTCLQQEAIELLDHIRDLEAQLTAAEEECQRIRDWLAATAAPLSPEVGE